MNRELLAKVESIRFGIGKIDCADWNQVAEQAGTTVLAVQVVARGLGVGRPGAMPPSTAVTPAEAVQGEWSWEGRLVIVDGANVAGWGRPRGAPRLAQLLALVRWLQDHGARVTCWLDASFRWALKAHSAEDASVLERLLQEEADVFRQAPAGGGADLYVLSDAMGDPECLIVSGDRYQREVDEHPVEFGWVAEEPWRFVRGSVASNGDLLLNGTERVPVCGDCEAYLRTSDGKEVSGE